MFWDEARVFVWVDWPGLPGFGCVEVAAPVPPADATPPGITGKGEPARLLFCIRPRKAAACCLRKSAADAATWEAASVDTFSPGELAATASMGDTDTAEAADAADAATTTGLTSSAAPALAVLAR